MSQVKRNMFANLAGGLCTSLLSIVFIPLYLRYLGIEAYGLIGFFATLQAVFGLLDMGLGLTLMRGLARLSVQEDRVKNQRDLLRTLELVYWAVALTTGATIWILAGPIAGRWVHAQQLTPESVTSAVRLMGLISVLRFPFALYRSGLLGLQRHVLVNVISVSYATLQSAGAAVVVAYLAPTINAFFLWQLLLAFLQTGTARFAVWHAIKGPSPPTFRGEVLRAEWRFAATVSANAVIGVFLTQTDKVLLSGLLPLSQFGYYSLAGTVAAAIWWLIVPINTALYPRFTQLVELHDEGGLRELYHTSCQVVALVIFPVAGTLACFSHTVVFVWTRNAATAEQSFLLVTLLVIGTACNGIVSVPAYLQSAAGWPQLMMYSNLGAAAVLVPAIVAVTPRFGAAGAAAVWLVLNLGYVVIMVPLMHRRLLVGEVQRWYGQDVFLPAAAVLVVATVARVAMPSGLGSLLSVLYVAVSFSAMAGAVLLTVPRARGALKRMLRSREAKPAAQA